MWDSLHTYNTHKTQLIKLESHFQKVQNGVDQYIQGLRLNELLRIKD